MSQTAAEPDIDAFTERVVREVIRRLLAMDRQGHFARQPQGADARGTANAPAAAPHRISAKLITAASLETLPPGTTEVVIPRRAVVTPLARDEAKLLGILLTRSDAPDPSAARAR